MFVIYLPRTKLNDFLGTMLHCVAQLSLQYFSYNNKLIFYLRIESTAYLALVFGKITVLCLQMAEKVTFLWQNIFNQRQRCSVAYSKGLTAPMFYYLLFFPEALHMEGVVVESSKGAHYNGNREF